MGAGGTGLLAGFGAGVVIGDGAGLGTGLPVLTRLLSGLLSRLLAVLQLLTALRRLAGDRASALRQDGVKTNHPPAQSRLIRSHNVFRHVSRCASAP